jgi:3-hydroxyphenylacetate 6-hydroxylase
MCIANHLAHKALYTAFLQLIAHFEILPAVEGIDDPKIIDPLEGLLKKESFVATPRNCTARLVPRDIAKTRHMLALK